MGYIDNIKYFIGTRKRTFQALLLLILAPSIYTSCLDKPTEFVPGNGSNSIDDGVTIIDLNLRIHIMRDIIMLHPTGVSMDSWVSPDDVEDVIIPEVNAIWSQARINWNIESIVEEDVVKDGNYESSIAYIINCTRDAEGTSDPARLPLLYSLMQPDYRSRADELGKNLFHIYLFPFIGNTSQGNAMSSFDFHCVLGTWSNKHTDGTIPEKTLLVEYHNQLIRGSLSRTAAHELGHVLNLKHEQCTYNCLMSGVTDGYLLTKGQIEVARLAALERTLK